MPGQVLVAVVGRPRVVDRDATERGEHFGGVHRPGETLTPNSSAIASHVRFRDRNCPCHRYAHAAVTGAPNRPPVFFRSDLGAGFARPSDDGGLEEFRELCASRVRNSATCAASASICSRSMRISVSPASITWRSRALAVRCAAIASGTGGTLGTNHR